jgi:hypothetical protein
MFPHVWRLKTSRITPFFLLKKISVKKKGILTARFNQNEKKKVILRAFNRQK